MAARGVQAASHFEPLHSSPHGRTLDKDLSLPTTDRVAASLVRLPIYPGLADEDVHVVATSLREALGG
jgi:dTDP-4-amino-4,6-dideoxygalactose transaminase